MMNAYHFGHTHIQKLFYLTCVCDYLFILFYFVVYCYFFLNSWNNYQGVAVQSLLRHKLQIICPDTEDELESATAEVSKVAQQMSSTAFSQLPECHSKDVTSSPSLVDQVMWETEAGRESELAMADCESEVRDDFPLVEASDSKPEVLGGHGSGTDGYECVVVTAALMESLHEPDGASRLTEGVEENDAQSISGGLTHTPTAATPLHAELYEAQALQGMVGTCELADQHATLQGSQVGDSAHMVTLDYRDSYCVKPALHRCSVVS